MTKVQNKHAKTYMETGIRACLDAKPLWVSLSMRFFPTKGNKQILNSLIYELN